MSVGQIGKVCGRKVKIVAVYAKSIRVLYMEPSQRSKMMDLPFKPFETNVSKRYWYCVPEMDWESAIVWVS
jgi:hypothetical protein